MSGSIRKRIAATCPVCSGDMVINRLACSRCDAAVEAVLNIPPYFRLPDDLQHFVMTFLRCRGNIREVERELGISYPTVCKRLDLVNALLGNTPADSDAEAPPKSAPPDPGAVLSRLERGEITAREAAQLLKGNKP